MTDFAGLRPSLENMSLSGVERLPYQDAPPQEEPALDMIELIDKCSTKPLSAVSEADTLAEATEPKPSLFGSLMGKLRRALCLSSEA